tara:strand:- start:98 stop:496 length:399 start_codon:yes stop_codon:yes gene_type:complete
MSKSPEYKIWVAMRKRCNNKNADNYSRYGGRGIQVCSEWNSFEQFYKDIGPRPSDAHSIERINNDGNYQPSNCCWATSPEQARNTRRSVFVDYEGKKICLMDFAQATGLKPSTLYARNAKGVSLFPLTRSSK